MDVLSNLGSSEVIFILLIILLVMGPHRLPEVARVIGQTLYKIRKAYQEFVGEFEKELHTAEKVTNEVRESIETLKEVADLPTTILKSTAKGPVEKKSAPELIDALPTHDLVPREEAEGDSPTNG